MIIQLRIQYLVEGAHIGGMGCAPTPSGGAERESKLRLSCFEHDGLTIRQRRQTSNLIFILTAYL